MGWAHGRGIRHLLINPKPMQNAFIESFNGMLRTSA